MAEELIGYIDMKSKGRLFLLTGLSGAGKSTLGNLLVDHLNKCGTRPASLIDGDMARGFFDNDLSYDEQSRDLATKRMAFGAKTLVDNNIDVVLANIAGSRNTRSFLMQKFFDFIEIYLDVDLDTLVKHDVKGVYDKHKHKERPMLVGVDIKYEVPEHPDVVVYPYKEMPEQSLERIISFISKRGPAMGTKAETLTSISGYLKNAYVLPQVVVSCAEYLSDRIASMSIIRSQLGVGPYVVRSSCRSEDSKKGSNAGVFASVLDVSLATDAIERALKVVRNSYEKNNLKNPDGEQILVQPMLSSVKMAGVVCTRHEYSDSPYYIVNYDDVSGRTDTVTAGAGGKVVYISRFIEDKHFGRWRKLIKAICELEALFPKNALEVEFAVDNTDGIVVLQVRPLNVVTEHVSLEQSAGEIIQELKLRFKRCCRELPHVPGKYTILSDMSDWNPSEIIGDKPTTLSYSIYRSLVTERTWHEARASQGYFDVSSGELMLSMARKPFIDTRLSFASLTPAKISDFARTELVDNYLGLLKKDISLHDKVEFAVAYTCYDLSLKDRIRKDSGLSGAVAVEVTDALIDLTNDIVSGFEKECSSDYAMLKKLDGQLREIENASNSCSVYYDFLQFAYLLVEHTRKMGIYPFARLARCAFIAKSFISSVMERGLISKDYYNKFMGSISTVATKFSLDLAALQAGSMSLEKFLSLYGHLRMSTYDICSSRYDQMPEEFWRSLGAVSGKAQPGQCGLPENVSNIDKILRKEGLSFDAETMFGFVRSAIEAREDSKFRFTKSLSRALEYLAEGGAELGLERKELQFLALPVLLRFRNPEFSSGGKTAQYLRQRIGEKTRERSAFDLIRLPSVVAAERDIEVIELSPAKPNFISSKCVTAPVCILDGSVGKQPGELNGHIVVIEKADPGYDWIFSAGIAGLITKYGGVASHMAIRCHEFDLPGAIGCGDLIYQDVIKSASVRIDCGVQAIFAL